MKLSKSIKYRYFYNDKKKTIIKSFKRKIEGFKRITLEEFNNLKEGEYGVRL